MSGSGGARGYDYQADGYAYVAAHGLAGQPLNWFENCTDVPDVILMETGGAGDDQRIITTDGKQIELQAKHALKRGDDLFETLRKMVRALNDDADLRTVIMIDRHASETISEDLRKDIIRLGEGRRDDLKQITKAVLADLNAKSIATDETFQRLRIVTVDLDEGSDGMTAACALLGKIVSPTQALIAYKILGKRGHSLMKNRGREEVKTAAEQLSNELGLLVDAPSPIIKIISFSQWVQKTSQEFYSPALGKRFPIDQAWNLVRSLDEDRPSTDTEELQTSSRDALSKAIQRYQEWHRLAGKFNDDRSFDATAFIQHSKHSVLLGGPGAGKSTLSKRLTYELGRMGMLVIRIRLKSVATLVSRGHTFDEAMCTVAVDGSGITMEDAVALLARCKALIADGLDECDPIRSDVAAGLKAWTDSHPSTLVCVLTRPVGHVPDLLPGFAHAELLPLNREAIQSRVKWFTEAVILNPSHAASTAENFLGSIDNKLSISVASIASRNPLLLTFLVRLHIDGIPIAYRRAPLFESILELMIKSHPLDRPHGTMMDRTTAWRTAEVLGWECLERPESSVAELTEKIAKALVSNDDAGRVAEAAISFWEEHGLIERLTLGSLDAITFVHPALCEYAAARHLSKLAEKRLSDVVYRVRRNAKYREPILLAAGCGAAEEVVTSLLSKDEPLNPSSTEAVLAAAALAEIEPGVVRDETIKTVLKSLHQRLESPIPLVAIEAGVGLMAIASLAPEIVGPASVALWDHSQEWTQIAARAACLTAGTQFVGISRVTQLIAEFASQSNSRFLVGKLFAPDDTYELKAKILPIAAERIINELPFEQAEPLLKQLLESKSLSAGMMTKLSPVFRSSSFSQLFDQVTLSLMKSSKESLDIWGEISERMRLADRVFLESTHKAIGVARHPGTGASPEHPNSLSMLLTAMQYPDAPLPEWQKLSFVKDTDVVAEVIRGAISACRLSNEKLGKEVNISLDRTDQQQSLVYIQPLIGHIKPDWSLAVNLHMNPELLAAALKIPCWPVAVTAAELLVAGAGGMQANDFVQKVLNTGKNHALALAGAVVQESFGSSAFVVLNKRLQEPLTPGCGYLYSKLIKTASSEQLDTAKDRVMEGLQSDNGCIASGAAETLKDIELSHLRPLADQLSEALKRWEMMGSWCDRCNVAAKNYSCAKCNVIVSTPRTALIPILAELGELSVDELIRLTKDTWHEVPKVALESLKKLAGKDQAALATILEKVSSQEADLRVLDALLSLPSQTLREASSSLLELLDSPHPDSRARIVLALSGSWIDHDTAIQHAKKALNDSIPTVRNNATITLRALMD